MSEFAVGHALAPRRAGRFPARFPALGQAVDLDVDPIVGRAGLHGSEPFRAMGPQDPIVPGPHQHLDPRVLALEIEPFEEVRLPIADRDHTGLAAHVPDGVDGVRESVEPSPAFRPGGDGLRMLLQRVEPQPQHPQGQAGVGPFMPPHLTCVGLSVMVTACKSDFDISAPTRSSG